MRPQDLLPAFTAILREFLPEAAAEVDDWTGWADDWPDDDDPWWQTDECDHVGEFIWDSLVMLAPDGFYFGASEGDGSDYGFWPIDTLPND